MNDELFSTGYDAELPPGESEAIDRLLSGVAGLEDRDVDYKAMLRGIKARARDEGIVIFPSAGAKKRSNIIRRIALGAATAAAVFVLGFTVMKVVDRVTESSPDASKHTAAADPETTHSGDKTVTFTKSPAVVTETPVYNNSSDTAETPAADGTEATEPVNVIETSAPVESDVPETSPFPTEFSMRGGTGGYVELAPLDREITVVSDLVPDDLPGCMTIKRVDEPALGAYAEGVYDGQEYSYTCRVLYDVDSDLSIGVARYKLKDDSDKVSYLWRVSENTFLEIEFTGFDRKEAESYLLTLADITLEPAA